MEYKNYDDLKKWVEKKSLQKRIDKLARKYKNKKVAVYGAGQLASVIFDHYDLSGLNIVAVADRKFYAEDDKFHDIKAISPVELENTDFDVIFLAVFMESALKEYLEDDIIPDIDRKIKIESIVKKSLREKFEELFYN